MKKLLLFIAFSMTFCHVQVQALPSNRWVLVKEDGTKQFFVPIEREHDRYISIKRFCAEMGCKVINQWNGFRMIIKNPKEVSRNSAGAVISFLTQSAIIDGSLAEFNGNILPDEKMSYLLPLELASKLASGLHLGRVEPENKPLPQIAKPQTQNQPKANPIPSTPVIPSEFSGIRVLNTLVIDPGHGGNDMGTKHSELFEKDITLFYALKLKEDLQKAIPDLKIVLTRDKDDFVALTDRALKANLLQADLFLSLHVNHSPNPKIYGSETYILNPNATDDTAKRTALLENDLYLKSLKEKDTRSPVMRILADMEQTKYIQRSAIAAAYIQQELSTLNPTLGVKNRGVKQAMFYVLSQVAMPSVLVEMGFLSSPADRARLMEVKFRDQFTEKLITALKRYKENPAQKPIEPKGQ